MAPGKEKEGVSFGVVSTHHLSEKTTVLSSREPKLYNWEVASSVTGLLSNYVQNLILEWMNHVGSIYSNTGVEGDFFSVFYLDYFLAFKVLCPQLEKDEINQFLS